MRLLVKLASIGFAIYVMICAFLVMMEPRLIYPGAYLRAVPTNRLPKSNHTEPFDYRSTDGRIPLRGRVRRNADGKRLILFLHGNGERSDWLDDTLVRIADVFDATVVAAEYRGFQDEVETPTESGVIADSVAALDAMCARFDVTADDVILYGRSLGGGCAAAVASERGAKAIILERTFDRLVSIAALQYPWIPVDTLMKNRFDSVRRLTSFEGPVVQIHGDADELIPIQNARKLFESLESEKKSWIRVSGMSHEGALPRSVLEKAAKTLEKLLDNGDSVPQTSNAAASFISGTRRRLPNGVVTPSQFVQKNARGYGNVQAINR